MDSHFYEADAVKAAPDLSTLASEGYPTDGSPELGTPATLPGAAWFYSLGEEIRNAIIAGGKTPDKSSVDQLGGVITDIKTALSDASDTYATKSSIVDDWYAHLPINTAATHNCFYRGKDLTSAFDDGSFSTHVADGSFTDIFPGDFITKSVTISGTAYTIKFIVADLDWWLNRGDQNSGMTSHHAIIVPETAPFNAYMNSTNSTTGGYVNSYMNQTVMPAFATGLRSAFGSSHILKFRNLQVHTVVANQACSGYPGWTGSSLWGSSWYDNYCSLMNESMVYGTMVMASSGPDEQMTGPQLSAFRHNSTLIWNRQNYWLSDVASSSLFAAVYGDGRAHAGNASSVYGVRPFALLA